MSQRSAQDTQIGKGEVLSRNHAKPSLGGSPRSDLESHGGQVESLTRADLQSRLGTSRQLSDGADPRSTGTTSAHGTTQRPIMSQAFRDDLVVSQSDAKELKPTRDEAFYSGALTTALTDMSGISASRKDDILKSLDVQFTFAKEADEDTWKANQSEWDRNTVIGLLTAQAKKEGMDMDFYRIREEVSMIPTEPSTHISTEAKIPETLAQAQPEASSQSKPRTIRSIISRAAGPLKFLSFATGAVRFALPYGEKRDWVSPSTIASVGYYGDRLECAAAVTSLGKVIGDWRASRKAGTDTVASSPRPDVASGPHG